MRSIARHTSHIVWGTLLLLLVACSHGDSSGTDTKPAVLSIYVYAPEHPLSTRADVGRVDGTEEEATVHTLQIWVFTHEEGRLVGYVAPTEVENLNALGGETYQMVVDDDFARAKPPVDVYVVANVDESNCGISFDANTTRNELEAAMIGNEGTLDAFGLTIPTSSVPRAGLPMSGALRNQTVYGSSPVLRIGTASQMATTRLVRMVSKLRFVICRSDVTGEGFSLESITLDEGKIPTKEYVFLQGEYNQGNSHIATAGYEREKELVAFHADVQSCPDPLAYSYHAQQDAQEYEELITQGIREGKLTQAGLFYLRESDQKLEGTITYSVNNTEKTARFAMSTAGDFSRNHNWIVYAYYGSATLEVSLVDVLAWQRIEREHEVYNW